jgi:curved DNA-binding protein CbpA
MRGDHYQALGVPPTAGPEEIRAAYLRLMREHHPDLHPGDLVSAGTAREVNAAYEVLGDQAKRAAYDRLHVERVGTRTVSSSFVAEQDPTAAVTRVRARERPDRQPAYSEERAAFRQDFSVACLRVAVAVMVLGAILLLAFTPGSPAGV